MRGHVGALVGVGLSVALGGGDAGAAEALGGFAFGPGASVEGGVEYRAFHELNAGTGDLHALRIDANGSRILWRAAQRLQRTAPEQRIIVTQDRAAWAGIAFEHRRLSSGQRAVLDESAVHWLRGEGNPRRLGPIVGAGPVPVAAPRATRRGRSPHPTARDETYAEFALDRARRPEVVYVSSNAGLLHAFDAGNGNELFAYLPNKLIDGHQRFATRPETGPLGASPRHSSRIPGPAVEDAYVGLTSGGVRKTWRTVLVGGLGEAGKGYFAIDVTDPHASAGSAESAAEAVLWEFTDADDVPPLDADGRPVADLDDHGMSVKDLGYATSQARIAMSNVGDSQGGRKWVAVLGNGDGSTAGRAVLFALFIDAGFDGWAAADFVKVSAGIGSGLGEPALVDLDLNGTLDRAYAGDLEGNLHRFDLSSSDPEDWQATHLFQARYGAGQSIPQPIAARPQVFKHSSQPGFMVVFATGVPLRTGQPQTEAVQSLYGLWDLGGPVDGPLSRDSLVPQRLTNMGAAGNGLARGHRVVAGQSVNFRPSNDAQPAVRGWRIDFDAPRAGSAAGPAQHPGERAHDRLLAWGNLLLVTTLMPPGADGGAVGAVLPIEWATGASPRRPVLDLNGDGVLNESDLFPVEGEDLAPGVVFDARDFNGPLAAPQVLPGFGGGQLILGGGLSRSPQAIGPPISRLTGRLSWREFVEF